MKKFILLIALASFFVAPAFMPGEQEHNNGKAIPSSGLTAEARAAILTLGDDLAKLNESQQKLAKAAGELASLYLKLSGKVQEVSRLAAAAEKSRSGDMSALFKAILDMEAVQDDGQLYQLQAQNVLQHMNQSISMIVAIIKQKNDTLKAVVNNNR
jgi:hypothetical protein